LTVGGEGGTGGTRLAVKGNGNVGIGTETPTRNLDVQSLGDTVIQAKSLQGGGATLILDRNSPGAASQISFQSVGLPDFVMGTALPLANASDFSIYDTGIFANALTIQKSSGNVGIGTTGPNARLDVLAPSGKEVLIGGGSSTGSEVKFTNTGTQHFSIYNSGDSNLTFAKTSSDISTNTLGTALMTISSNGNVGIGVNAAAANKLQVNGQTRTGTLFIDTYVSQVTNGLPLCTTSAAGANMNLVGLCNSSSLRYKTNVNFFRSGMSVISRLRPISFDWKENGARDLGLAAEEVEKVEPLLTFRNQKGEIEGVRYDRLGVLFINAFKEQQQQIALQQTAARHQQEQIDALRKDNEALNARATNRAEFEKQVWLSPQTRAEHAQVLREFDAGLFVRAARSMRARAPALPVIGLTVILRVFWAKARELTYGRHGVRAWFTGGTTVPLQQNLSWI
jgi:endosialidase-like protein